MKLKTINKKTKEVKKKAREKHPPFTTWYEVYGALTEEMEEFWAAVKADHPKDLLTEHLIGLAATAFLAIEEAGEIKPL